jgi:hypothetical protein
MMWGLISSIAVHFPLIWDRAHALGWVQAASAMDRDAHWSAWRKIIRGTRLHFAECMAGQVFFIIEFNHGSEARSERTSRSNPPYVVAVLPEKPN